MGFLIARLKSTDGGVYAITVRDGGTVVGTKTVSLAAGADDTEVGLLFELTTSPRPSTIRIQRIRGGPFKLDVVVFEQATLATTPGGGVGPSAMGSNGTCYTHLDDGAEVCSGARDILPNGSSDDGTSTIWSAFGTGAQAIACVSVVADQTYVLDRKIDGPPGTAFAVELQADWQRAAIDFDYLPAVAWGRNVLESTPSVAGPLTIVVGRTETSPMSFYLDAARVWEKLVAAGAIQIPRGYAPDGRIEAPAPRIVDETQMWITMRTRIRFGTTRHGGGSNGFFRWYDDDAHGLEMYYSIGSDGRGTRREGKSEQVSAGTKAKDVPAVYGETYRLIGRWADQDLSMSVNGTGFTEFKLSR